MKICIFSGIFPPEIGGPAVYAERLVSELKERDIGVRVITYSASTKKDPLIIRISKKYPRPLSYLVGLIELLRAGRESDIIYSFALTTIAIPPFLASKILRKKFIIRLGGDFLWERAVEEGRTKKSLREYYKEPKTIKEKFWFYLIRKILKGTDRIIFTGNFQKEIYKKYFGIQEEKTVIISNPFPEIESINHRSPTTNYQFLYAGRLIKLKNLDLLVEVFARISKKIDIPLKLKLIGEGPEKNNLKSKIKDLGLESRVIIKNSMPHFELLKEIQKSYLFVLPSLTEVSPNLALECIKLGKPILLTKETGIFESFKNHLIFIDPQDSNDIEQKLMFLLNQENYQRYEKKIKSIPTSYSWKEVTEKHLSVFKELVAFK